MNARIYPRPLAVMAVASVFLLVAACGAEAPAAQPEPPPESAPAVVETAPTAPAAQQPQAAPTAMAKPEAPAAAAEAAEPTPAMNASADPAQPAAPEPTASARALPAESDTAGVNLEGSLTEPTSTPESGGQPVVVATEPEATQQPTEAPPPTAIPAPAVEPPPDIPVGTKEGDRVPDFSLELVDGSTVTSADFQAMDQPVFLFFTATF